MPIAPSKDGGLRDRKYPYYAYAICMKLANVVKEHGGERAGVPKSVIASEMALDQSSASFSQIVASAKTWGIVEGGTELGLTELGREYFYPTTEHGKRVAELSFLVMPTAYAYLVKEFDGSRIPSTAIMANKLGKACGVPESWRMRAAQLFVNCANDLEVLDQANVLRYAATKHIAANQRTGGDADGGGNERAFIDSMPTSKLAAENHSEIKSEATRLLTPVAAPDSNVWFYNELEKTVRVETPALLTRSLWKRLKKYIELIEPFAESTEGSQSGSTE